MDIITIYYGAFKNIAPDVVRWVSSNNEYIAVLLGLGAISTFFVVLFGIRRNKRKDGVS